MFLDGEGFTIIGLVEAVAISDLMHHTVHNAIGIDILGNLLNAQQIRSDLVDQLVDGFDLACGSFGRTGKIFDPAAQVKGHDA